MNESVICKLAALQHAQQLAVAPRREGSAALGFKFKSQRLFKSDCQESVMAERIKRQHFELYFMLQYIDWQPFWMLCQSLLCSPL